MENLKIPILTLAESRLVCRTPSFLRGKRFSIMAVGVCSFRCKYCLVGGYLPRSKNGYLIYAKDTDIEIVKDFILEQIKKGNPIKLDGGEVSLLPNAIIPLLKFIKKHKGFSCIDTNGSNPEVIRGYLKYSDMIGIDIKGTPRILSKITGGASLKDSWFNPLKILRFKIIKKKIIEVKIPVFSFTTLADIFEIVSHAPENSYIILRKVVPEIKTKNGFKMRSKYPKWFDVSDDKIFDFAKNIIEKNKKFKNRVVAITSSGRENKDIHYF